MNHQRRHRWIAWLLPLFILRAFVPVGFMVHWSDAGLQLVLCTGAGPAPTGQWSATTALQHHDHATAGHDAHAQHHVHSESSPDAESHKDSLCPFAALGAGLIDAVAQCPAVLSSAASAAVSLPPRQLLTQEPISLHRIRGPPSLLA